MIRWQRGLWAGVLGMTLSSTLHAAATVNAPATSVGGMADMGAGQMTPAQSAQLALDLATSMERIEKYPDAIAQYERALAYDAGNPQAIRRLAVLYSKTGQFDRADVYFQKAAHAQPHNANVFNDWGRSYYLRGNWTMAEKKFRDALQTEPRHRLALNNLALTLGQEKRYSEAFQIFRNGGLSDAQAHCNMAYILSSQGRVEEARSACQLAKRLDATFAVTVGIVDRGLAVDAPIVGSGEATIAPKLLVTVGVMGALDFLEAIKGNPTICAIGCDPGDPIGAKAAYMVAGDVGPAVRSVLAAL
jgi:Flp pilus assembly protein TadD